MNNITDWISAGANIAMAVTAFMAYRVGRNYLSNLTNNDAYKLAFEIKDELIPALKKSVVFTYKYRSIEKLLNESKANENISQRNIEDIFNRSQQIRTRYLNLSKQEKKIIVSLKKLDGYGWGCVDKKETLLKNISTTSESLVTLCDEFDDEIDAFVSTVFGIESIEGAIDFDIDEATLDINYTLNIEHIDKLLMLILKIRSVRNEFNTAHDKYISGDNYIGSFFKRNKGHL
jgi:hypothetical protein